MGGNDPTTPILVLKEIVHTLFQIPLIQENTKRLNLLTIYYVE